MTTIMFDFIDQVTLIRGNNLFIDNSTKGGVSFNRPVQTLDGVVKTDVALAGYDIENEFNLQYGVQFSYLTALFSFQVQAYNQTKFGFISFFVILFQNNASAYFDVKSQCIACRVLNTRPNTNRSQVIGFTMRFNRSNAITFVARHFFKSMMIRQGGNGYSRLRMYYIQWPPFGAVINYGVQTYQSVVSYVCATVVLLLTNVINTKQYLYQQRDYTIRQFAASSLSSLDANFGIPSVIYGPIFNKRCIIGFSNIYFKDGTKLITFDLTKEGITNIQQITPQFFISDMNIFCIARVKVCGASEGVQTVSQQCVGCGVMIKNCFYCKTQQQCLTCSSGYFIDSNKRCCPNYLKNCLTCNLADSCTLCSDGYYLLVEKNQCISCAAIVSNCTLCRNQSFCYKCNQGYTLTNSTLCTKVESSSLNSSTDNSSNNSTNNTNNTTPNTTSSSISTWMIIAFILAGVCLILLTILIFVCLKKGKKEEDERQLNPKKSGNGKYPLSKEERPQTERQYLKSVTENDMVTDNQGGGVPSGMVVRMGSRLHPIPTKDLLPPRNRNLVQQTRSIKSNQVISSVISSQKNFPSKKQSPPNHSPSSQLKLQSSLQPNKFSSNFKLSQSNKKSQPNKIQTNSNNKDKIIEQSNKSKTKSSFSKQLVSAQDNDQNKTINFGGSLFLKADYYKK